MKLRTIGRHGREGFKNLFRNGWMTVAAISAVAVTLLILGASLVLSVNVQAMSANIENQLQFNAYVSDSVPTKELPKLGNEIHAIHGVRSVTFISKAQALQKMKKLLQTNADLINGLGNPLPNEFVIQVVDPHQIPAIAREVKAVVGIGKVEYGGSVIPKLLSIMTIVRDTAIVFIAGLVIMGMFLISNTIKITIFTRRREIEIMKLVGATDGFIRGPFFVEGTLMGIVGALLPSLILYEGYRWLEKTVTLFPPFSLLPTPFVMDRVVLVLVGCGLFIGLWGSVVSMRKFLRV
ncbi:MAG: permease-like cell division protein FtsX [Bacilli bacterium]